MRTFGYTDEAKIQEFVKHCCRSVPGRDADATGLAEWDGQLNAGAGLEAIVNGFAESGEFKAIVNEMK